MKAQKAKRIRNAFLILLCVLLLFLGITFLIHRILLAKEMQMLTEAGYSHPVSVGDYSLNVYEFGNPDGAHTFVGMSGKGTFDYSVRMGLIRLAKSLLLKSEIPGINYTDEQRKLSETLNLHSRFNYASAYEDEHAVEICTEAFRAITANDVPKVYICAGWGFQTREEVDEMLAWDKQDCAFTGRKQPKWSEAGYDMERLQKIRDAELQPYLDKMGNCELVLLPGVHYIFDQRPDDCAEIIRDFLDRIGE